MTALSDFLRDFDSIDPHAPDDEKHTVLNALLLRLLKDLPDAVEDCIVSGRWRRTLKMTKCVVAAKQAILVSKWAWTRTDNNRVRGRHLRGFLDSYAEVDDGVLMPAAVIALTLRWLLLYSHCRLILTPHDAGCEACFRRLGRVVKLVRW